MTSTSRDVARAAGVSVATVSRAFSEAGAVSETTRRKVLTEARRLGYSPNPAARRLITGRSGNIGIIVPDLANPFFADIIKGVQRRAREGRQAILVADTDEQARLEGDALRSLARQVDGVILASPRSAIETFHRPQHPHRAHPPAGTRVVERDRRLRRRRPAGSREPARVGAQPRRVRRWAEPVMVRWHAYGVAEALFR